MEALMESKYEVVAAVDARVQLDNSGHKRPRDEKGSQRIGESSDSKLVGHRHDVVFNVVNPSNTEWELFQKKWKEFDNLFFPPEPKATTLATIEEANNEGRKM
ncbi:hypothetical protein PVK06_011741 [Gossypium arboreum]|uniref:Uncharacterized protein n=1 Tax=Gossypium arboreum TaxID=29729 RepID=A0ABR0Q9T2_GOSAR|nr:hypothetical protein PVK06_011741 [Gossypium arboreum]